MLDLESLKGVYFAGDVHLRPCVFLTSRITQRVLLHGIPESIKLSDKLNFGRTLTAIFWRARTLHGLI